MPETALVETASLRLGGGTAPLFIAGPDTLESHDLVLETAKHLHALAERLGTTIVFKGSYDKANRSSHLSYRGPGLETGLEWLREVRAETGMAVTTDVHTTAEIEAAAPVCDILQIPAFLCRQNDLLRAAADSGCVVNIKKGQFLPPWNAKERVAAATGESTPGVVMTERGSTFGHGDLVNDFRGVVEIRAEGIPVIFDATHSVQRPGGLGDRSGGRRDLIPYLARAAAGVGCDGFFFEAHPRPDDALCDGPCSLRLDDLGPLIADILAIDAISRREERNVE